VESEVVVDWVAKDGYLGGIHFEAGSLPFFDLGLEEESMSFAASNH